MPTRATQRSPPGKGSSSARRAPRCLDLAITAVHRWGGRAQGDGRGRRARPDAVRPHIDSQAVPGAVVGVLSAGAVSLAAAGTIEPGGSMPLDPDAVVRISSNTKPIVAALALAVIEDGTLTLATPVDVHVPELADRRVLRRPDADLGDTVPAGRPITVRDLLTMR